MDLGPGGLRGCPVNTARVRVGKELRCGLGNLYLSTDRLALQAVIGDSEHHHFLYRIQPEHVRVMEVGGDVQLELVKIF